jgi:hypothetical protein
LQIVSGGHDAAMMMVHNCLPRGRAYLLVISAGRRARLMPRGVLSDVEFPVTSMYVATPSALAV